MNSKKLEILNWRANNPEGTKSACAKELKISGSTVAKWWDLYDCEKCPDKVEPCTECNEKKEEDLENEVVSESLPEEKEHVNEKCYRACYKNSKILSWEQYACFITLYRIYSEGI